MRRPRQLETSLATLSIGIFCHALLQGQPQGQPARKQIAISLRGPAPLRQIADRFRHQFEWQINY